MTIGRIILGKSMLAICAAVVLSGCGSTMFLRHNESLAQLGSQQKSALLAKKNNVPCRIEIICPDDMTGKYSSFFSSSIVHYPLKQILRDSFNNAVYCAFEQPGGEVLDAFTLKVDVFKSQLEMDSSDANYNLYLMVTFDEPGEKKVVTIRADKMLDGAAKGRGEVPPVIYTVAKDLAIDVIKQLKEDPKVVKTISRFEKK